MDDRRPRISVILLTIAATLTGCVQPKPLKYFGDAHLQYYKDVATEIKNPLVCEPTPDPVKYSGPPRTLDTLDKGTLWDMSLAEALQLAMANSDVILTAGTFRTASNPLYTNPNFTPSVYDPAIQDTGVLFGGRGVEAALADFDTQFSTSMIWGRNETAQNNAFFGGGINPGATLTDESGVFTSELRKQFATGGVLSLDHDWMYHGTNVPAQLFPSAYTGSLEAAYRQPLLAGSGIEFTRIAGAIGPNFGQITGVSQGVVIARINNDISLADFEASIRNLIKDVENLYWELYLHYREFDSAVVARNSALEIWGITKAKFIVGATGGGKAEEAQARDAYFSAKASAENFLSEIYSTEIQLRRLLGLPVNDGRVIRPSDQPLTAELVPDWYLSLTEALTRRVELRRQKWNIKSLDLQLTAAKSLTRPRLDFVSAYRVNAFGDQLFGKNDNDGITAQGFHSAYETLTQGNQTGWNLGFEFTAPIGFRSAHAQADNLELRLAKARATLARQELEISHELATAFQNINVSYRTAVTNFNRRIAAEERVDAEEAKKEAGLDIDKVLRALGSQAEAEIAYYTSVVRYNQSITDLDFRKGTLLESRNIFLRESEWTPQAYQEALRRAWARSHAKDTELKHTVPPAFVAEGYPDTVELAPLVGGPPAPEPDSDLSGAVKLDQLPPESPEQNPPAPVPMETTLPPPAAP